MKRTPWVLSLTLLALPAAAAAQSAAPTPKWTLTLQGGIHLDRFDRPERYQQQVIGGDMVFEAFTARGEAPTLGVRATRWLTGHMGLDAGLALAHNTSWQGSLAEGSGTTLRKLTLFSSVAPVFRVQVPNNPWQLQVGAGPALIAHMGSGESLLARSTDVGAMALVDLSTRLSRRLQLVFGAQNYRFSSRFDSQAPVPYGGYVYPTGNVARSEWVITTGLRVSF